MTTTLDMFLDSAYTAVVMEGSKNLPAISANFQSAVDGDPDLLESAKKKLSDLRALQKARGFGGMNPCVVSSVQKKFLEENLDGK